MFDAVFHQRLKEENGNRHLKQGGRDVAVKSKLSGETDILNGHVTVDLL